MARLVVVSNRVSLPGERTARAGGLAVAMREALAPCGGIWFGWSGRTAEATSQAATVIQAGGITYATVDLCAADHAHYYVGYANSTLWPLLHHRLGLVEYRRAEFEGFLAVNGRLADALRPLLRADDLIWVHDYHLIPFAAALRRLGVDNRIGFFLHTPCPPAGILRALPHHQRLIGALCQYDLVGFQTAEDRHGFAEWADGLTGGGSAPDGSLVAFGRRVRTGVFPIGIDAAAFASLARRSATAAESVRLRQNILGRDLIIGVDRLDYSKGLPNRFRAIETLLAAAPRHRGRITYLQITPQSRSENRQYRALGRELEAAAGRINGRFAEFDWTPIRYLNKSFPRSILAGFYRLARVALVTPLRDGMNLVAKEYVAAQDPEDPGVLVLSRFAGAAAELGAALLVNPLDIDEMAEAVARGLAMPRAERLERWRSLVAILRSSTAAAWREAFLAALLVPPDDGGPACLTQAPTENLPRQGTFEPV